MPIRKLIRSILQRSRPESPPTPTVESVPPSPPKDISSIDAQSEQPSSDARTEFELVLYGRSSCPYCVRVDRVIKELELEDKFTRRNTGHGTEWRADLRARTGRTQVPCLFIDGEPMFESLDIIEWIQNNLT